MDGEWLGNGWGVSNLCAPSRGIPGRGLSFPETLAPFYQKCLIVFLYKTSLFTIKRPDPGGFAWLNLDPWTWEQEPAKPGQTSSGQKYNWCHMR